TRYADAIKHLLDERAALGGTATPFALASNEGKEANCRVGLFDFGEALRLFESAYARFASIGAEVEATQERSNSAYLHLKSGRYAEALRLYAQVADVVE